MWDVKYLPAAEKDLDELDGSQRKLVLKAVEKVRQNPLPQDQGGYGKSLGNKAGNNLTGLLKIKLKALGIRVVYRLEFVKPNNIMRIVVIALRDDNTVYNLAAQRIKQ